MPETASLSSPWHDSARDGVHRIYADPSTESLQQALGPLGSIGGVFNKPRVR
jgi:hypothetical protein